MNKYVRFFITFFLGPFGVHKFIDKKIGLGIVYLLTCGIFGFGWIIDTIIAFINMFKTNENQNKAVTTTDNTNNTSKKISNSVSEPEIWFGVRGTDIPSKIGDTQLTYRYSADVQNIDWNIAEQCRINNNFNVDCDENGVITCDYGVIGAIEKNNKVSMVTDWKAKGLPFTIEINSACKSKNQLHIRLAFYRNNYEYFKDCQKTTVSLTRYSSIDCQSEIELLDNDTVLSIDEDGYNNSGDPIYAVYASDKIGVLNKKASAIYEDGIKFIMLDHIDYNDNDKAVPYVTIFY